MIATSMRPHHGALLALLGFAGCFGSAIRDNIHCPAMNAHDCAALDTSSSTGTTLPEPGTTTTDATGTTTTTTTDSSDTSGTTSAGLSLDIPPVEACGEHGSTRRIIFVTEAAYAGDLKPSEEWDWESKTFPGDGAGIKGAKRGDFLCNCAAQSKHSGRYLAWLSDSGGAIQSILEGNYGFEQETQHFTRPDGTCIADSWPGLWDMELRNSIGGDGDLREVWTGKLGTEQVPAATCADWESVQAQFFGVLGIAGKKGPNEWMNQGEGPCDMPRYLYCIQVNDTPLEFQPGDCP